MSSTQGSNRSTGTNFTGTNSTVTISTVTPLLGKEDIFNEQRVPTECSRATTIIIVVLLSCGTLALAISAGIWHFHGKTENDQNKTTTSSNTPHSLITTTTKTPEKRIIGYSTYFDTTDITKSQLSKLTHAVFAFLQMNADGTIEFNSENEKIRFLDLANKSKRVTPNVKVLFSIGGYENSDYFPMVIDDPKKKRGFIDSIVLFIKEHQIDGVDIDWRWPGESNKSKYSAFLKELRKRLNNENKNYILSIKVPKAGVNHYEKGFDMDEILEHVDFVNVLSMGFYGPWPSKWGTPAGPSSPLYSSIGGQKNFNVNYTMKYYSCETMQPNKFNIAITFSTDLWKNVKEAVQIGNEVIRHVELIDGKVEGKEMTQSTVEDEKWKTSPATWDETTKSSYIWNPENNTYLTFESNQSMKAKVDYVNEKNLGGIWIWSVGMDDEKNTLLNTLCSNKFWSTTDEKTVRYEC